MRALSKGPLEKEEKVKRAKIFRLMECSRPLLSQVIFSKSERDAE